MGKVVFNLKRQWFEAIAFGDKRTEYRRITDHWSRRLERKDPPKDAEFVYAYTNIKLPATIKSVDRGPCPIDGWDGEYIRTHFSLVEGDGIRDVVITDPDQLVCRLHHDTYAGYDAWCRKCVEEGRHMLVDTVRGRDLADCDKLVYKLKNDSMKVCSIIIHDYGRGFGSALLSRAEIMARINRLKFVYFTSRLRTTVGFAEKNGYTTTIEGDDFVFRKEIFT